MIGEHEPIILLQDLQRPTKYFRIAKGDLAWELFPSAHTGIGVIRVYGKLCPYHPLLETTISSSFLRRLADHLDYLGAGERAPPLAPFKGKRTFKIESQTNIFTKAGKQKQNGAELNETKRTKPA